MHLKYCNIGLWEDKVIEEASEVIKAIIKAKRFGLNNYHPTKRPKVINKEEILSEIKDLRYALDAYEKELICTKITVKVK